MNNRKIITSLVALSVLSLSVFTGCGNSERLKFANQFKSSVTSGDYETAMMYTTLGNYDYLSDETFGNMLSDLGVTSYLASFNQFTKAKYDKEYYVLTLTTDTNDEITFPLNENGLISNTNWYNKNFQVIVPEGSDLYLDDNLIDYEYISITENGTDTYNIPVVLNYNINLTTIGSLTGEYSKEVEYSSEPIDMTYVSEEALENLRGNLTEKINRIYNSVVNNYTTEDILRELPQLENEDNAKEFLTRIESNQRPNDEYIGYTDIHAELSILDGVKIIGKNKMEVPVKIILTYNMSDIPTEQIINTTLIIKTDEETGEILIDEETSLKFFYTLQYEELKN